MAILFDYDAFGDAMNKQSDIKLKDHGDHHGWNDDSHGSMQYKHDKYEYKTWRPDTSAFRKDAAIQVSCKIDQQRTGKDDHVVLIAIFNREGHIVAAQAGMESIKHSKSWHIDPIIAQPSHQHPDAASDTAVGDALDKAIAAQIKESKDGGFEYMSHIARLNLLSMVQAVKVK